MPPHQLMRARRTSSLPMAIFITLLVAGCNDESSGSQPGPPPIESGTLQRLEFEALGDIEIVTPVEREAAGWPDLSQAGATEDWDFGGAKHSVLQNGRENVLAIFRDKPVTITIPVDITFRDTPQVNLDLVMRVDGSMVRAQLMDKGKLVGVAQVPALRANKTQALSMTFPTVSSGELHCDTLLLKFHAGKLPVGLETLSIEDIALGGYLPAEAFGGVTLVEIGTDSRRGTCISNRAGARTKFRVEDPLQELSFSYVIPKSVLRDGEQPLLRVGLRGQGGASLVRELEFAGSASILPTWTEERISLADFDGQEVTASFELISKQQGATLAVIGEPHLVKRVSNPRTVLLITSDTHRADHLGFLSGEGGPKTAFLDRLAAQGVSFLDATASINNTTPSHVALFTGLPPRDTGIVANAIRLSEAAPTLADLYAELGYVTLATVSAAPVCSQYSGLGQGFDRYSNPASHSSRDSRESIAQLEAWLDDYEGRPLFAWIHLYDAHSPYEPPEELLKGYYPDDLDPYDPASPVAALDLAPDWNPLIADPHYTDALYNAEVNYVDERLASFMQRERFWNGSIAFTADHGETLRSGEEFRYGHRGLSHANLAVPLILRAPGLRGGEQYTTPVSQIDVGRTLLDISGHHQVEFPGRNLLLDPGSMPRARFAMQANGFSASILEENWMLQFGLRSIRAATDKQGGWLHKSALFDISTDEACRKDLSTQHPERVADMRAKLVLWLQDARRQDWQEAARGSKEAIEKQLSELGYVSVEPEGDRKEWYPSYCPCEECERFRKPRQDR